MQPFPLQTQTFDHLPKRFKIIKSTLKEELTAVSCNGYVYDETMKNIGNFKLWRVNSNIEHLKWVWNGIMEELLGSSIVL